MARKPKVVAVPSIAPLDRSAGQLGRQLAEALRLAVRQGKLRPGDLLPSSRLLAQSLAVSRGTVIEAFEQLLAEGVLEAQRGAGTRISRSLEGSGAAGHRSRTRSGSVPPLSLSERAAGFAEVAGDFAPLPHVPFAVSVPSGLAQPGDVWRRIGNRVRARGPGAPSGYGDGRGVDVLRDAVAEYVRRSRSVQCTPEQVIITSGIQQSLFVCCQILCGPGDDVWVEDPAYRGITAILEHAVPQVRMIRVPVDDDGIEVDAGIALSPRARVAFVTPSHQYPLGMPMSMARRNALLAWARSTEAWIVEDDYDSELRYAGHPFPSLQGLDPSRVIYLGTFSKILFPSLRLGYAVVPGGLADAFCGARVLMDRHPPSAEQYVLAEYMMEKHLDRHIRRIRSVYAERRAQLFQMVEHLIPREHGWLAPGDQGMHVVLWLAPEVDDRAIAAQALASGVATRALSPMYSAGHGRSGLVLGLSDFEPAHMRAAIRRLAMIIAKASQPTPSAADSHP